MNCRLENERTGPLMNGRGSPSPGPRLPPSRQSARHPIVPIQLRDPQRPFQKYFPAPKPVESSPPSRKRDEGGGSRRSDAAPAPVAALLTSAHFHVSIDPDPPRQK